MPHQPSFDLQSHSVHSDGSLPAAEVVERAAAAGVELLALTDHDTVDGVPEAAARAREHGLRFSPAAELSAVHGDHEDLHILGYELDASDPDLTATARGLPRRPRPAHRGDGRPAARARLRARRRPAVARREAGKPIGRPHLADAVLAHPANAAAPAREGIAGKNELFPPYLVPGAQAYVARSRPTVDEAIEVIHAAGGVAVWAHPFWDVDAPEEALATLRRVRPRRARRRRVLLRRPTPRSRPGCCTTCAAARAADHRLGRLPRPRSRPVLRVPRLRGSRSDRRVRSDRWQYGVIAVLMSRRELIISGPMGDPLVSEQMQALRADPDGARERELELIEREADAFQVELVGKDGGLKARWDNLVGVSELWAKIDAMPTRRRALREAAAAAPQTTRLL